MQRRIRQGCSVSALKLILVPATLACKIRNDDEIRGLIWRITTAYADVANSLTDLEISKTEFSEIAGAKLD